MFRRTFESDRGELADYGRDGVGLAAIGCNPPIPPITCVVQMILLIAMTLPDEAKSSEVTAPVANGVLQVKRKDKLSCSSSNVMVRGVRVFGIVGAGDAEVGVAPPVLQAACLAAIVAVLKSIAPMLVILVARPILATVAAAGRIAAPRPILIILLTTTLISGVNLESLAEVLELLTCCAIFQCCEGTVDMPLMIALVMYFHARGYGLRPFGRVEWFADSYPECGGWCLEEGASSTI